MNSSLFLRSHGLLIIFFILFYIFSAQAKVIPKNTNSSDRKFLLSYFSNLYAPQYPSIPYFIGNYPGFEIGIATSLKPLKAIQKRFPSDSLEKNFLLSQLYIKKSLIHRLEIGLSTTLSSFNTAISSTGFGGHLMWHPQLGVTAFVQPIINLYLLSLNFEDILSTQELGIHFSIGRTFGFFSLNAGLTIAHYHGQFEASNQAQFMATSRQQKSESIISQNFFGAFQLRWNQFNFNFIQNYNTNNFWSQNLTLSYSL